MPNYKGKHIRISSDLSAETPKARKAQNSILQALKENNCQPRLVYPVKLSLIFDEEMKTLQLKQFMSTKPVLQSYLKEYCTEERH
jgi:hypothetical protein